MSLTFVDPAAAIGEPTYERTHRGARQYSLGDPWHSTDLDRHDSLEDLRVAAAQDGMRLRRIDSFHIEIIPPDGPQEDAMQQHNDQVQHVQHTAESPTPSRRPRLRRWLRGTPPQDTRTPPTGRVIELSRRMTREQQEMLIATQLRPEENDNEALLKKIRSRLDRCDGGGCCCNGGGCCCVLRGCACTVVLRATCCFLHIYTHAYTNPSLPVCTHTLSTQRTGRASPSTRCMYAFTTSQSPPKCMWAVEGSPPSPTHCATQWRRQQCGLGWLGQRKQR